MSSTGRWRAFALVALCSTALEAADVPRQIRWLHGERKAAALSRKTGKPLLIDFRADWCSACKMLDADTWPDAGVRAEVAAHFVPLQIDMTADGEATKRIAERYGIVGLPTILAGTRRIDGFVRPAALLEALRGR